MESRQKKTWEGKSFQTLKISFVGAYNPSLSSDTDRSQSAPFLSEMLIHRIKCHSLLPLIFPLYLHLLKKH